MSTIDERSSVTKLIFLFLSVRLFVFRLVHPTCMPPNVPTASNLYPTSSYKPCSYLILNPGGVAGVKDLKKAAEVILQSTGLDPENYRIGNTKAWIELL